MVLSASLMLVVLAAACGGSKPKATPRAGSETPRASSVELHDTQQVFTLLGGSPANARDAAVAVSELASLPKGTTADRIGESKTEQRDNVRVERAPYEVRVPGQPAKSFTITRVLGKDGAEWVLIATFVGGPQ